MDWEFLNITSYQWLDLGISLLIVIVVLILGRRVVNAILNRVVKPMVNRTATMLDDAFLETIRTPLYWLAVIIALEIGVSRIDFLISKGDDTFDTIFYLLYALTGFTFAWRLVNKIFEWYGQEMAMRTETELDEQLLPFFQRVTMIILSIIGIITLLGYFDVDVSAMVTTLGIGSLAIALAAQDTLADSISGFIIMMDRPFRIGDRIEIRDLGTWGDVVDIGLRSSRIRTRDNRMVIVPNSVIAKSLVVNYSYPDTQYRIQVHIGIDYDTDLEFARQTMINAIRSVEGVLPGRKVEALFLEFGDSAMIFRVRWWIESYVDTRRMFDRVNTALHDALEVAGIQLPNPRRDIFHKISPEDVDDIAGLVQEIRKRGK